MSALRSGMRCTACGGTVAPHSMAGATRGSCHCWRGPGRVSGIRYDADQRGGLHRAVFRYTVYHPGWEDAVQQFTEFAPAFRLLNERRIAEFQAAGVRPWPSIPMPIEVFNARFR